MLVDSSAPLESDKYVTIQGAQGDAYMCLKLQPHEAGRSFSVFEMFSVHNGM